MKKKIVWISLMVLVLLVAFLFVACSSGSKKSSTKKSNTNTSQSGNTNQISHISDGFGYDDNRNGVWDDLDNYISNRFPNDLTKQAALKQMSKALQAGVHAGKLKNSDDAQKARAAISKSLYCLLKVTNKDIKIFDEESSLLEIEMLKGGNDRSKSYQEFNALLSGGFYGSDQNVENPCE